MVVAMKVVLFFLIWLVAFGFIATFCWYLQHSNESWKMVYVYTENSVQGILSPCTLPRDRSFNAWKDGLVTVMKPEINKNCSLLFEGDPDEVKRIREENDKWNGAHYSKEFFDWGLSSNCTMIRNEFLDNFYVSREELNFQLAFSLSVHDNPQQVVRFLKVIYRPHNLYCIHYDVKTSKTFRQIFDNIAKCLSNIFIPSKIIKVNWGDYTILDAQLSCIGDLYKVRSSIEWKYLITLCGKELPLRTNLEIVRLLKPLNGTSALVHFDLPDEDRWRIEVKSFANRKGQIIRSRKKLGPVPHNLKIYKSLAYFGLSPEFVDYILHDQIAQDLLKFMHKGVSSAEEHFYSTLYHLPGKSIQDHINHLCIPAWCYLVGICLQSDICAYVYIVWTVCTTYNIL